MRTLILGLVLGLWTLPALACTSLRFDYSSFSRPPGKLDYDRYVAGKQDGYYLSVGLNGMTLQISPANTAQDQDLPRIWEDWRVNGTQHPDFGSFHAFHERPTLVETPFDDVAMSYHAQQTQGGSNVIAFVFLRDLKGRVLASLYLNDPRGDADWSGIEAELAGLLRVDKSCLSDQGRYEGRFDQQAAQYLIEPK